MDPIASTKLVLQLAKSLIDLIINMRGTSDLVQSVRSKTHQLCQVLDTLRDMMEKHALTDKQVIMSQTADLESARILHKIKDIVWNFADDSKTHSSFIATLFFCLSDRSDLKGLLVEYKANVDDFQTTVSIILANSILLSSLGLSEIKAPTYATSVFQYAQSLPSRAPADENTNLINELNELA